MNNKHKINHRHKNYGYFQIYCLTNFIPDFIQNFWEIAKIIEKRKWEFVEIIFPLKFFNILGGKNYKFCIQKDSVSIYC